MSASPFPNWFSPLSWVPQGVDERFNNGWTFGNLIVNAGNSRAPDIEREVVSKNSYGRQIGRLMDAVVAIAKQVDATADPQVEPLIKLSREIEAIKAQAKKRRGEELLAELKELKRCNPKAWSELVRAVGA